MMYDVRCRMKEYVNETLFTGEESRAEHGAFLLVLVQSRTCVDARACRLDVLLVTHVVLVLPTTKTPSISIHICPTLCTPYSLLIMSLPRPSYRSTYEYIQIDICIQIYIHPICSAMQCNGLSRASSLSMSISNISSLLTSATELISKKIHVCYLLLY